MMEISREENVDGKISEDVLACDHEFEITGACGFGLDEYTGKSTFKMRVRCIKCGLVADAIFELKGIFIYDEQGYKIKVNKSVPLRLK